MKKTLLTLNAPNLNGRIYRTEVIQKALDSYDAPIFALDSSPRDCLPVNLEKIIGRIEEVKIEGDELTGVPVMMPAFASLLHGDIHIRPSFIGTFEEDEKTLKEVKFISFCLTHEPA